MKFHSTSSPGSRLFYIRETILKLPRSVMAKKYNLKVDSLYNWESGRKAITSKVMSQYLPCLREEGVRIEESWILEGIGLPPVKLSHAIKIEKAGIAAKTIQNVPEHVLMPKEVSGFLGYHSNAMCIYVDSNAMQPFYTKGDYVCGILVFSAEELQSLVSCDCIIFLKAEQYLVRKIHSINEDGTFNLVGSQLDDLAARLENVEIFSAAEILLHRKQKTASRST